MKNPMNARNRLLAVLRGEPADRVPLIMEHFHYRTLAEVKDSGKIELIERVKNHLHFFHTCEAYVNRYMITPPQFMHEIKKVETADGTVITTRIDTPKGPLISITGVNEISSTTWKVKYPVESIEDIEKIRSIPWELPEGLAAPDLSKLPPEFEEIGRAHV